MPSKTAHKPIIFALNSNKPLAKKISEVSGMPLGNATINHFSDGEIKISIDESIRGDDVYIIQSLSDPVNDNLMELLIMIDAVRRTSSHAINVVIPYYGYSRSDRKAKSREPITAKLIASFLQNSSVDRVIAFDLHAAQIQGFFDIPVDHLQSDKLVSDYLYEHHLNQDAVVVAPDHNGVGRARNVADRLDLPIAIVDNRQPDDSDHVPDSVIGDVKGKNAIIVDDMIVTGRKMKVSAAALKKAGANKIYVAATHPVFSEAVKDNLSDDNIEQVIVTDSIVIPKKYQMKKISVISVGNLIGEALKLIQENKSTHVLF
ncbi:ribose-phosphate pyrophosphokinase [Fructilactobacillus lindneri]|uniref:Ribose-phosphate pyrophosphokinase n=2 Tax=Fructilactobacillus lindneri TaxID=53444 RepID=A0A0R2JUG3_9LACO|nr:ribose-phosphate pyrophosphokinase [Fructilactobacillus lindneri]ANZ58026.1 ribose-phosphate pyrophosphokinase [Fructilactobacillus lindneri]ANZ59296.1 ribose-phosphate pyrophosphokinase [Fructilactobacillus lindneri]KRN78346.1 ribose-phosphate pyrophosphokinase 1 [Fructilactobacillus lindneri DSM 20690 = JCM 11027]POH00124.1 ribose-phosphate pyrophosphokinase [Fructilactobacillus lindneri]POH04255.1 ribose-phosphate pyrophosphokinase [Fructilactobacillus lindneri]